MTTAAEIKHLQDHGLYSKSNEHDACGLGFVAHIRASSAMTSSPARSRSSKTSTIAVPWVPTSSWVTARAF